jgi:hypothetical protein
MMDNKDLKIIDASVAKEDLHTSIVVIIHSSGQTQDVKMFCN